MKIIKSLIHFIKYVSHNLGLEVVYDDVRS